MGTFITFQWDMIDGRRTSRAHSLWMVTPRDGAQRGGAKCALTYHGQTKDKGSEAGKALTPFDYLKHISIQTVLMDTKGLCLAEAVFR